MWSRPLTSVLVTGGAGFIGSRLVRSLSAAGHPVRVLDDLTTGRPESVAFVPGATLVRGSVLDVDAVAEAARGTDLVLHLAGVEGMQHAAQQAELAYEVGSRGTANVLAHTGDTPVVLVSSSAVYGFSDSTAELREEGEVDRSVPLAYDGGSPGAATGKWEMERLGREAARFRPVLTVRPFNVVGTGQRSHCGTVVATFFRQAVSGEPLTIHGDGSQHRCFTDIDQFTRRLLDLMDTEVAWRTGLNVFNIGSRRETTINNLARQVLAATRSTAGFVHVPYESVFPGRTDVTRRMPCLDRLASVIGETEWLSAREIVREMARVRWVEALTRTR
ncbi:NAD-dependent epimerase/dehydratase family protein [Streptomyces minutiscleroticus]|uniref:Epimerase n=1 Tax=Streptomyces minutiscleroticus TaxID=68238 RepID=A0A918U7A6_9ACTN|nr:NAD-dependent epimerase/dehydratase family protein [Streptomyces minutiscleroticus]GGY06465.1 epimerase [Streptomyces minutiscleroticus]